MTKTLNSEVLHLLSRMDREDSPRGLKVVEDYLTTLEFNPLYPMMNFENKAFNWKYFVGELWWYLSQETTIDKINNFSSFWKTLTIDDRVNSNYGYVMISRQHNQFKWALNALLKDRSTRQAIMVFNTPTYQNEGVKDFVCTMYVNFWIRDNKLNMKVQMRSNDIFYGLQYDAPFFSIVYQSMYLELKSKYQDLEIGTYYHCSDNTHYYERHFTLVEKLRLEQPNPENDVELRITRPIFDSSESGMSKSAIEFVDYMEQVHDFSVFNTYDYIDIFHKFFVEE
jgi:thymidylate synthase